MKQNEGKSDRIIRVFVGLALLSLWYTLGGGAKYIALIGLIPLLTAAIGWCPLYSLFGISTNKK